MPSFAAGRDDRQRARLHPLAALRRAARPHRCPAHHPAALHAALERQGRESDPHPPRRMGLRAPLAELPAAREGPEIIRPLLQPQAAPQQPRRPATHQPRSQRPWLGHLGPGACRACGVPRLERAEGGELPGLATLAVALLVYASRGATTAITALTATRSGNCAAFRGTIVIDTPKRIRR